MGEEIDICTFNFQGLQGVPGLPGVPGPSGPSVSMWYHLLSNFSLQRLL